MAGPMGRIGPVPPGELTAVRVTTCQGGDSGWEERI